VLFRVATSGPFERAVRALPGSDDIAWRAACRYVAGRRQPEALTAAARLLAAGHGVSIDLFGDLVTEMTSLAGTGRWPPFPRLRPTPGCW
jgi:proline dehydrogenase